MTLPKVAKSDTMYNSSWILCRTSSKNYRCGMTITLFINKAISQTHNKLVTHYILSCNYSKIKSKETNQNHKSIHAKWIEKNVEQPTGRHIFIVKEKLTNISPFAYIRCFERFYFIYYICYEYKFYMFDVIFCCLFDYIWLVYTFLI